MTPIARLRRAQAAALRPEVSLTVSAWADAHRILSTAETGEPGKWETSRTPYLREIMDCLSATRPETRVVVMKGARIGFTEAGLNWCGYVIAHAPGPMMVVMPTIEVGEGWSKARLANVIDLCPEVRARVRHPRDRKGGDAVRSKEFDGGVLFVAGANSAASLAEKGIRYLFLDEVDRYPGDVDGEGSPIKLAEKRTGSFGSRKKILLGSTPTIAGVSAIEREFLRTDQRRFFLPCPRDGCGHEQVLAWKNVRILKDEAGAFVPEGATYACEKCGGTIEDREKTWMLARGEWRATAKARTKGAVGFHLSALYSPHGMFSWADAAAEWVEAQGDPVRLRVFVNTVLGETYDEAQDQRADKNALMARRENWTDIPLGVTTLTAGIDVQANRLEVHVVGWGIGEESWSVAYDILPGDPTAGPVWAALDLLRSRTWTRADGAALRISASAIDTGGSCTQAVYDYGATRVSDVWCVKGRAGKIDIWPRKPRWVAKGRKVPLYVVGVDTAKEQIYSRLQRTDPGPGAMHFPMEREAEFFAQLTAEHRQIKFDRKGRRQTTWIKRAGDRNEVLDATVYAYAAVKGLQLRGVRLDRALDAARSRVQKAAVTAPTSAPPAPATGWGRGRGGWSRR